MNINKVLSEFKEGIINSKKYWIIYLAFILIAALSIMNIENFMNPKLEIITILILSLSGILCISHFHIHKSDKELYKTAFIIILIFGIIFSFVTPILYGWDELEHFIRAEQTSHGEFLPEYVNGSFMTIQTTLNLLDVPGKVHFPDGLEGTGIENSTIFHTNADVEKIDYTPVPYHSAFAQNPFYGYLAPAIGMFIAKLLDLNSIWLLWLGRIFNALLYACLIALTIKKTPILKIPMIVFACVPLAIFTSSTITIDSFINGMSFLTIAYFFYMVKPKENLTSKNTLIFTFLVLLVGTCKVSCFAFIFLLPFIPKKNFEDKRSYLFSFVCILSIILIALLWTKFYANPGFFESWRSNKWLLENINTTEQINYVFNNNKETLISLLNTLGLLKDDISWNIGFHPLNLLFIGAVGLMYPIKENPFISRIGALITGLIFYVGTYFIFLLSWTPIGQLSPIMGVQVRYFIPIWILMPFIFGFNHMQGDKGEIDSYVIMITIVFIAITIFWILLQAY